MARPQKEKRPEAQLPKGFRDIEAGEIRAMADMLARIRGVYEIYGFEPLETPAIEYTDALGKFLPDQDRPNEGVFSFTDEDGRWLSLRYDLTAPLARYVAANYDRLPKPFRRYAVGPVWRNEKPGPGRFRQFMQFDADTVGTDNIAADAEICMLAADTMEALGFQRGDYVIKVNSRKVLDGVLEIIGLGGPEHAATRLTVLRAVDKLDRLGIEGVRLLLGPGRRDESGDFTKGAGLSNDQIDTIAEFLRGHVKLVSPYIFADHSFAGVPGGYNEDDEKKLASWKELLSGSSTGTQGVSEITKLLEFCRAAGFGADKIRIDATVVRGLEYYTGPVFEAELTFQVRNEEGQVVRFGSVGGGGRYDDLVARFTGQRVPATGFSIGVSRLQAAITARGQVATKEGRGPVVVLVMDRDELPRYQRFVQRLRAARIPAELYLGTAGMKAQMKYADRRGSPCVVIQGGDERAKGEVQIKDLIEGARLAATITDAKEWREARPAQFSVPEAELVSAVQSVLARHGLS